MNGVDVGETGAKRDSGQTGNALVCMMRTQTERL